MKFYLLNGTQVVLSNNNNVGRGVSLTMCIKKLLRSRVGPQNLANFHPRESIYNESMLTISLRNKISLKGSNNLTNSL